jgi:hypothetical protein
LFEYGFEVTCSEPLVGFSRPITFSVRPAVRIQIEDMLKDGIIEISTSRYMNPLTIVIRDGRAPRIYVDARCFNAYTLPDCARVLSVHELLQQFHGSKYINSIDLSSAFLQIPLAEESRKYTAFLLESHIRFP